MNFSTIKSALTHKYVLWILLSIPSIGMTVGLLNGKLPYEGFMHASGEFAARFLIISLIATPLTLMFPGKGFSKWLLRNRRYFGVAAGLYGLYHTVYYLFYLDFPKIMGEFWELGIITGWIATFVFIPLLITSNDLSVRRMGKNWKKLQRWVYLAAIMVVAHWIFLHYNFGPALVHFTPVVLLQVYRVWKQNEKKKAKLARQKT